MSFARNVKTLREKNNLTVRQLADELQVSKSTISGWENNTREPSIETLLKLFHYFKVSLDVILGSNIAYDSILDKNGSEIDYKNIVIVHNYESKSTLIYCDGKLVDGPITSILFKHEIERQYTQIKLSLVPGKFSFKESDIVWALKKMGYPIKDNH